MNTDQVFQIFTNGREYTSAEWLRVMADQEHEHDPPAEALVQEQNRAPASFGDFPSVADAAAGLRRLSSALASVGIEAPAALDTLSGDEVSRVHRSEAAAEVVSQ